LRFEITDSELKLIEGIVAQKLILGIETEYVAGVLKQLRDTVINIYGSTVAAILFYHLGRVEAERIVKMIKDLGIKMDFERLMWMNGCIKELNVERNDRSLVVRVINRIDDPRKDLIVIEGEGCGAGCYYLRGYIEKLAELIFNKEVSYIREVECRFRGSDYCKYQVVIR